MSEHELVVTNSESNNSDDELIQDYINNTDPFFPAERLEEALKFLDSNYDQDKESFTTSSSSENNEESEEELCEEEIDDIIKENEEEDDEFGSEEDNGGKSRYLEINFGIYKDKFHKKIGHKDVAFSSDRPFELSNTKKKKGKYTMPKHLKRKENARPKAVDQIQEKIELFIRDPSQTVMALDPMFKKQRKIIHQMANYYELKSKSIGSGHSRYPILTKTASTKIPQDKRKIISVIQRLKTGDFFQGKVVRNEHGTEVAANASPIDERNKGNKMLQKMGWKPGESLGTGSQGLLDPIKALYRDKRRGLGA